MSPKKERDIEWLQRKFHTHKGKWLTAEAVKEYQQRVSEFSYNQQMVGERRKFCQNLNVGLEKEGN